MATLPCPMPTLQQFEPAERNPKKLRNTALILVAVMVVGGWFVMKAYEKWVAQQAGDDRPAYIHRIQPERSLRVVLQDGEQADLVDLRNKVFVLNVIHPEQLDESARSFGVMKRLAAHYAGEGDFRLVTLVLDAGDASGVLARLEQIGNEYGMATPQWWLGTNELGTMKKFISKELKPQLPPDKVDGRWVFDASITLVGRNGHIRRAVVPQKRGGEPYKAPFDFDQAAAWDADGIKTGTELSNEAQLEVLLRETIDKLLDEAYKPS